MKRISLLAIGLAVSACAALLAVPAAAQTPHTHQHGFGDAEKWAKEFDDPKRDAWQKPHEVIRALALKPDAVVADIGSGTGYFAVRFAHMVPKGRVYGLDTEPDMVKYLAERAKREGLRNLISSKAEPGDPRLPEKADLVILVDVYHHVDDRERYFGKLRDVAQARWPRCGHRLPHGFPGRSAEGGAHRARTGEGGTQAGRLRARQGARLPAEPVFPRIPAGRVLIARW